MTYEVRCYSRSGNTMKIAKVIAEELNVTVKNLDEPITKNIDILFLGGALYAGKISTELKKFINSMNPNNVKCVVVFSTSASNKTPYDEISELLKLKNIPLAKNSFHARGKFLFANKNKPDINDFIQAKNFTKEFKS